jgi:hypothetical protein
MEAEQREALIEAIESLPPEKQKQVREYVDQLGEEAGTETEENRHLRQGWAGGFSDLGEEYTSVELQHQALEQWKKMVRNS